MPDGFFYAEYNNLESVKKLITDRTAAVLVEAVQGEGGVVAATPEFMKGLRQLCTEQKILLFCDEVQCGMGRTGDWFGFEESEIEPDAFSLAKSLGSGFPIGAVTTKPELADVFQPGKHASTFGGNPLACAAALATLNVIEEENLLDRALDAGDRLSAGLRSFVGKYPRVKDVRGRGLMLGLALDQAAKPLVQILQARGLLAAATAETVARFLPPLNVKDNEIDEALEIIEDALAEWHGLPVPSEVAETAEA
jgi:acetylornithine/succinyldiaminopimelate/putrescine aminotransferase